MSHIHNNYEAKFRGGGKTGHVVFMYLPKRLL
jgi:hypothetical protein